MMSLAICTLALVHYPRVKDTTVILGNTWDEVVIEQDKRGNRPRTAHALHARAHVQDLLGSR